MEEDKEWKPITPDDYDEQMISLMNWIKEMEHRVCTFYGISMADVEDEQE